LRLPRVRTMSVWGFRFLLVGLCIGLIMPFFMGGPASMMFRLSPLYGTVAGAVFGIIGGAIHDLVKPCGKGKTVIPEL
jgi:hypothetical protein